MAAAASASNNGGSFTSPHLGMLGDFVNSRDRYDHIRKCGALMTRIEIRKGGIIEDTIPYMVAKSNLERKLFFLGSMQETIISLWVDIWGRVGGRLDANR